MNTSCPLKEAAIKGYNEEKMFLTRALVIFAQKSITARFAIENRIRLIDKELRRLLINPPN